MKFNQLTCHELVGMIKEQNVTAEEVIEAVFKRIDEIEKRINAFISVFKEEALRKAREIDEKIARGEKVGPLAGIPVAVKDNICTRGKLTTCGSKMLSDYVPPYSATVVERIEEAGGIVIGKTNMDEFAMGNSTESSYFGCTRNPWDTTRVPGGSSGGSGAALAADETILALGSDTGGSIRCPASFCGIVGLKPTYGLVSRYGLIAYANSLEQIGPMAKDVMDCALLLSIISGNDARDSTSAPYHPRDYTKHIRDGVEKVKVGVPKEFFMVGVDEPVERAVYEAVEILEELGAKCEEFSISYLDYAVPTYYLIAMSEASSNLARFDGLRYGFRAKSEGDWNEVFLETRGEGFGEEVKRRIILGTFALSAGYYDRYYLKALKVRALIRKEFERALAKFDVLVTPTMPTLPFKIGEIIEDPLTMYMMDICTVPVNLAGVPSISIPCGFADGLPVGMQIIGGFFKEDEILRVAYAFQKQARLNRKPQI
ncbi:MAG: Asp-tRNA(Asn)/Glu-tRNA(Gln) amidotransferase subunit GatA [Candidatus Freyarchaeota archaeon]|nr:Asp-tRNA(Asn)/Glu-tRNA(Gln) amidotransferase subunit GatA [Candidatus Freyrarchaeum guaymaensis]